ncbi:DUF4180 domain-containing protein [Gorillibacterium sp. sgz5001074]|uniref:DUF4180 domain-containing protein n=1 Tax=Gorillibacterium sp. sgz5001074 TaxID=3446695 RepID=UPI003F68149F
MSIPHAILGILSSGPQTGYELKKIIQDSPFMPWSGNNNQIYKALVELLEDGFATNEVHHQDSAPSKKIYTITESGSLELKRWVQSAPEVPELRNTFLIQLAWSDVLNREELHRLLSGYENELRLQAALQQEKRRRPAFAPDRTPRERVLWESIHENILSFYRHELEWIGRLRDQLDIHHSEEANGMGHAVIEKNNRTYIQCASEEARLGSEQEALDLIGACWEHDTRLLLLHADALPDDFFRLRTGLAGSLLQKFVNYGMKVAAVVPDEKRIQGKMKELLAESNKGKDFRVFSGTEEAEEWLLSE